MKQLLLKTEDNIKIAINHYDSNRDTVVIICHGWHMCKDSKVFKAISKDFHKNYDVITMDFRGHGKSTGFYTFSAKEPNDLKTVVDYAKTKYKKIYLIGFSLGAASAIIHTAQNKDIDKLIAISTPVSFDKIENHYYKKEAYLPTLKKFELWRTLSVRPGNLFLKKINPIDIIQNISPIPVLLLTGSKDPTIYPWHSEELFNKANNPKSIEIFQDNFHAEDLYLSSPDRFINVCNDWMSEYNYLSKEDSLKA
ncbi:MAG: hypothetical protein ACD_20C00174G0011 [uncultured bacterium]|nr:MAG: hypothetical protein ACD_20C00174G0011 [uncultured bacterium]